MNDAVSSAPPPAKPSNLNVPNILTSIRILAIPLFAWLVLRSEGQHMSWMLWSLGCFVALMITDKLDGDIARAKNLVTDFGKIADPIADKALISTALICLNINGSLPVWVTIVILVREIGITIWRMFELRKGNVVPASKGGKLKTVLQTIAVTLFLIPPAHIFHYPALAVMLIAVVVTTVTGCQYIVDSLKLKKAVTSE